MKTAVIYHSVTGNTKNMAEHIVKGMSLVEGVEAKAFPIEAVDEAFVNECSCVVFGGPIYAGHISAPMFSYIQMGSRNLKLAGKLVGAFATAQYVHGGAEVGIHDILDTCMVKGALIYSGGGSFGAPVIHFGPVGIDNTLDIEQFAPNFEVYGQRMAGKAAELFAK